MIQAYLLRTKFYAVTPNLRVLKISSQGSTYLRADVADGTFTSYYERFIKICILTFWLQKDTNEIQFLKDCIPYRFYILVTVC
jgi:hypothetical protein